MFLSFRWGAILVWPALLFGAKVNAGSCRSMWENPRIIMTPQLRDLSPAIRASRANFWQHCDVVAGDYTTDELMRLDGPHSQKPVYLRFSSTRYGGLVDGGLVDSGLAGAAAYTARSHLTKYDSFRIYTNDTDFVKSRSILGRDVVIIMREHDPLAPKQLQPWAVVGGTVIKRKQENHETVGLVVKVGDQSFEFPLNSMLYIDVFEPGVE